VRAKWALRWRHRGGRTTVLKHGAVPTGCPHVGGHCEGAVTRGDVQQLDVGASGVAFVWNVQTPG